MNRLEGVHPDYIGYDLILTPKERRYLQSLADSRSVLDRRLCLEYLDKNYEVKSNARFILGIFDQLIPDSIDMISGQALLQLEMFFSSKDYYLESLGGERESSDFCESRLKRYESWDPVRLAWPIILKHCSSANRDLRRLSGVFLLMTLLKYHFDKYFPKVRSIIDRGNARLLDAMGCCYWLVSVRPETFNRVDGLFTKHLTGDRLNTWKRYCKRLSGETERPRSTPVSVRPKADKNRLLHPDSFEAGSIIRFKPEEKEFLVELSKSKRIGKRIRSLEVFEKWRRVQANKSFFFTMVDNGLGDKNVEVRSFAAILIQENWQSDSRRTLKLILKHGSSNSPDTQRMIAIGPLGEFMAWKEEERLKDLCKAVERGGKNLARTVSQILLWNMASDSFDRLDSVLGKKLDPDELNLWKKRCRSFRENRVK